jgi:hypothetical protein
VNKNKPWTADDDRRLVELRSAGRSILSIAAELKRTAGGVEGRIHILNKRRKEAVGTSSALKAMASFDPYEPAVLHDRVTDRMETWTGEDGANFRKSAISNPDGTVEWKQLVFDGWGNVLGG